MSHASAAGATATFADWDGWKGWWKKERRETKVTSTSAYALKERDYWPDWKGSEHKVHERTEHSCWKTTDDSTS
jgi:hypothetical protein